MNWIKSNTRRPEQDGFYYTKDSVGQKEVTRFLNRHWHSLTGHPVSEWLDENADSDEYNRGYGDGIRDASREAREEIKEHYTPNY